MQGHPFHDEIHRTCSNNTIPHTYQQHQKHKAQLTNFEGITSSVLHIPKPVLGVNHKLLDTFGSDLSERAARGVTELCDGFGRKDLNVKWGAKDVVLVV